MLGECSEFFNTPQARVQLLPKGIAVAEKPLRPTDKSFRIFPMAVGATGSLFAGSAKGFVLSAKPIAVRP
jgi:hypothetical protein